MMGLPGRERRCRWGTIRGLPDPHLATAHLSGTWDSDNLKYRLNFILACSPEMLNGGDRQYQANLKQCMVTLSTDKCTADFFGAYECTLSADDFSTTVTSIDSFERHRIQRGQFGAGIAVTKPGWMSRILGKLSFGASRKDESRVKFNRNTKSEEVVSIISYRGNHWAVGDDIKGDPRRGGWLRGQYFQEQPTKPLCEVDLHDRSAEAKVRIDVWARPGQIVLYYMRLTPMVS
jgi:hypothetical protein